jgi:hypothetical protein
MSSNEYENGGQQMIIKSLEHPVYYRRKNGGLAGAGLKTKPIQEESSKTFEEYLSEAFQGEVVQNGSWFSKSLSDLTVRNLRRI